MTRRRTQSLRRTLAAWRGRSREAGQPTTRAHRSPPPPELENQSAEWADVSPALGAVPLSRRLTAQGQLVLEALNIPHSVVRGRGGYQLLVPSEFANRARTELAAYLREPSLLARRRAASPTSSKDRWSALACLAPLLGFFALTRQVLPSLGLYPQLWSKAGSAQAKAILDGELWRALTALTLHADAAHVLGNVVVGTLFVAPLAGRLGLGAALCVTIGAGGLGNLVNALAQGPQHTSVGFSTAVFGAAGALAAVRSLEGWHLGSRWTPLAAGLGLLALLGVGGERTDVGAHLFGFGVGLPLGALAIKLLRWNHPDKRRDALLGVIALGLPVLAWLWGFAQAP